MLDIRRELHRQFYENIDSDLDDPGFTREITYTGKYQDMQTSH